MAATNWLMISYDPHKESELFDWVVQECKHNQIHLNVLVVVQDLSYEIFKWFEEHDHQGIQQWQIDKETFKRQDWIKQANEAGVSISLEIQFGKMFYQAISYGLEKQTELLIKLADDIEEQQSFLFKSDDWHLLRKSPLPLLLYRENTNLPFGKVMASLDVDVDIQPYQATELNQQLLKWTQRLESQASINVVHAWQAQMENLVKHWDTDLSEQQFIELSEYLYSHHKNALNIEVQSFGLMQQDVKFFFCEGEPAEAIAQTAEKQGVDLLVLGTLGRGGIPGLLIGNTAEDLLERINCSVLAIKPASFHTPITLDKS